MPEFWKSSGIHLVNRADNGWLSVTPDYLRAYYTRPEIHPVDESCPAEHRLFEKLMADPFAGVADEELSDIADQDAADNYRVVLRFRDHLAANGTLEGAYATLFQGEPIAIPPVFIDQMVHLMLRGMLAEAQDPMQVRAAELFFRDQLATTADGQLMLADQEIVEMRSETGGMGGLGQLILESGTPMREVSLDVLTEDNKRIYWERSDRFDTAIDFRFTQPALDAFARVIEQWVRHFLQIGVRVQPMREIQDDRWSWHIGLDAEANRIMNALYQGEDLEEAELARIAGLFRMEFDNPDDVIDSVRNKVVYLGLAMDGSGLIKMKPQNLLTNMPIRQR